MPLSHVLVNGVGSYNGGAELLLKSAADRLAMAGHAVYADGRRVDAKLLREWDVHPYWSVPRLGACESLGLSILPPRIQQKMGFGTSGSINAFLDASGFALGDQWDPTPMARTATILERLQRRGAPIVLLPQAFGPFTRSEVATEARRILFAASAVYARDLESRHHVAALMGDSFDVKLCPDITIAHSVTPDAIDRNDFRGIAIVPNVNLVSRGGDGASRSAYLDSLLAIYDTLDARDAAPFFLLHSQHGDDRVLQELLEQRPELRSTIPATGVEAKKVLGSCQGIIAGRYHALVSGLAQGVPSVAHSWSHKYKELLNDFGVEEGMADPFSAADSVARLDALTASPLTRTNLLAKRAQLSLQVDRLWEDVNPLLRDVSQGKNS